MSNLNELERFENDLNNSTELQQKMNEAIERIAAEGTAKSDAEAVVAVAKELGYDISITTVEQAKANAEELDPEFLEGVSGGRYNDKGACDPRQNFVCHANYRGQWEDEYDHDCWCLTGWHCIAATLHTESKDHDVYCWSDYTCFAVNKRSMLSGFQD